MSQVLRGPLTVLGRLLLCTIFLLAAVGNKIPHFSDVAKIMESVGVPAPQFLLAGATVFFLLRRLFVRRRDQARNSVLFQPTRRPDLALPNRIVLAPMTRARAGAARLPNRLMAEYYAQRSAAGLLVTEATTISEEANGWNESPGIYTEEMTEGWKHTTNAVHEKGGLIFLQLWHMGRASHTSFHAANTAITPPAIKNNQPDIHIPTGKPPHEGPLALQTSAHHRGGAHDRLSAQQAE